LKESVAKHSLEKRLFKVASMRVADLIIIEANEFNRVE